jgi:hypothetical protein
LSAPTPTVRFFAEVMRSRDTPLVGKRARRVTALAVFVLAFAVRVYWTLRVQSPLGAVYSDMGGYVSRAEMLLAGRTPGDPRVLALWPWGPHAIFALEFAVFGRDGATGIGITHAFVGALAAPCASLLTARFVRSRLAVVTAGVVVALWHPHIIFSGYFSSELWFSTAITLGSLLFVQYCELRSARVKAAIPIGILLAIAFVVRPQAVMTAGMIGGVLALGWLLRTRWRQRVSMLGLLVPLALTAAFSSVRLYRLSGRIGLINLYEQAQRLFGETSVGKLDASWIAPNGERWTWWASPHTKQPLKPGDTVHIDGFIADPEKLSAIRKRRLEGVPMTARIARMADNVALLVAHNLPWPEDEQAKKVPFRQRLQRIFGHALAPVVALCVLGLFFLQRHRVAALVIYANIATIIFVAAVYLGEARYRIPYDPIMIVVATVGLHAVVSRLFRLINA